MLGISAIAEAPISSLNYATYAVTISEVGVGVDSYAPLGTYNVSTQEVATANTALFAGNIYSSSTSATLTATTGYTLTRISNTDMVEGLSVLDATQVNGTYNTAVQELATVVYDRVSSGMVSNAYTQETLTLADSYTQNNSYSKSISETITLTTDTDTRARYVVGMVEGISLQTYIASTGILVNICTETNNATAAQSGNILSHAVQYEIVTVSDAWASQFLWNSIDTAQTPNWTTISTY